MLFDTIKTLPQKQKSFFRNGFKLKTAAVPVTSNVHATLIAVWLYTCIEWKWLNEAIF